MGGEPTMTARGMSFLDMLRTKSSSVLKTRVFSYAERTKVSHFFWSTAVARSTAGSMRATTLRRGPSLLDGREYAKREHGDEKEGAHCSKRKEWFHGPSSDPSDDERRR